MKPDVTDEVLRIVNSLRIGLADLIETVTDAETARGMDQSDAFDAAVIALMSVAANIANANGLRRSDNPRQALHTLVDVLFDHGAKP